MSASIAEFERGLILRARYVLEDVIGRGGTSIVFRARDLNRTAADDPTPEFIALKLLRIEWRSDPLSIARLKREFRQMQCLSHPGIARVFDLDCEDEVWFMTMELVPGRTVQGWMREVTDRAEALRVIGACCDALEYAHTLGFLHGDLKPTNIIVADSGAVKLIDFGSAPGPCGRASPKSNPMLACTPLYASPQVLAGKSAEIRDDIFSLACLSYGILSNGRHPFGRRPSLEDGRAKSAPTRVSTIPRALFAVLERGLSAEPEQRPASAGEFLSQLTEAEGQFQPDAMRAAILARSHVGVAGDPGPVTLPCSGWLPLPPEAGRNTRRSPWPLVNVAALVIGIIMTAALMPPGVPRAGVPKAQGTAVISMAAGADAPAPIAAAPADVTPHAAAPHDRGVMSFEASTVPASAVQSLVAVSVKRLHGTRSRGPFVWRVEGGTAYPGVDYQRLAPQQDSFLEGQTVRTLFIPLMNTRVAELAHRPRSFTVMLQPIAGGPALGSIDRVTVTIDPPANLGQAGIYQARAAQ
jgi:predicted Ser/Thr protein kinase